MKTSRFSTRHAVFGLLIVIALEAFAMFWGGVKQCGGIGWGFYFLTLLPLFWIKMPCTALLIPIGFIIGGGGAFYRLQRYRPQGWLAFAILSVLALALGVIVALRHTALARRFNCY